MNRFDTQKKRLLIHHHDIAHVDASGEIWLSSGIARWVSALADQFESIGLLLHESIERSASQDTAVSRSNVELCSLGKPDYYLRRWTRNRRIRRACRLASPGAHGLLIRGMTPRQMLVWKYTDTPNSAFLLVRSPKQKRVVSISAKSLLNAAVNKFRELQYRRIARTDIVLMANATLHIPEIEQIADRQAHFVPTNTIRMDEFTGVSVRPISSPIRLLFVGRLSFLKGLRELLKAVAILNAAGLSCRLTIVAATNEPEYSQLRELADRLNLKRSITWKKFIPFGKDLLATYRSADVFVLPSYTEGFPRVLWEAAANCTPIVTTQVGGIPALLEDNKHALLVEPKNSSALVDAITRVISDERLRSTLIHAAHALALDYSVESCAKKLAKILEREWA